MLRLESSEQEKYYGKAWILLGRYNHMEGC
jgi:hypothetical protein